jgi:hypothetical protein
VITTVTARNASKAQHTVGCIAHSPLRMNGVRNRKGTAGAPPAAGNRRRDFCAPAAAARRRPTAATRRFFLPVASGRWSARMQLSLSEQRFLRRAAKIFEGRRKGVLAEGVGFEPTRELAPPGGFQDRCLKPLGHPSNFRFQRLSTLPGGTKVQPATELPPTWVHHFGARLASMISAARSSVFENRWP